MNPVGSRLPWPAGVYRTPAAPETVQRATERCGGVWIETRLQRVGDKRSLLRALADGFAFPSDFGDNWDALSDSLQDLSWLPATGYVVRLCDAAEVRSRIPAEWSTLLEICEETATYWEKRGRFFVVLCDGVEALPTLA